MKRGKAPIESEEEDELSSEMEVEEAKVDSPGGEDDDDDESSDDEPIEGVDADDDNDDHGEEIGEPIQRDRSEKSEFLDAFYGLASPDPRERSIAGQMILHHAVLGPQANLADAAYTLKRLLNGVCSGRAAARQGNASTLASFLKITKATGVLAEIQKEEHAKGHTSEMHVVAYVRQRLLKATAIDGQGVKSGRKRSAEVKDNNFGRLFGVLSIARSGILLLPSSAEVCDGNINDNLETTKGLLSDLHELYEFKAYMREPAAHAVCTLLNSFFKSSGDLSNSKLGAQIVEESIIPMFLEKGDLENEGGKKAKSAVATYSPEQIALALDIQSLATKGDANIHHKILKKGPLKEPILTKETLAIVASALADTCYVNAPRTHLVWDTLWLYLTESSTNKTGAAADVRTLRKNLYNGSENSQDVLDAIINHVVLKKLLSGGGQSNCCPTHDRKSLAFTLVRILAGVEFTSSLAGKTIISLPSSSLDACVFKGELIHGLFVDVIGTPGKKIHGSHLSKQMAVESLNRISEATRPDAKLTLLKSLVCCDSRFDSKTKSTVIQDLLGLNVTDDKGISNEQQELWKEFITFVQDRILLAKDQGNEEEIALQDTSFVTRHEAEGLVELLFKLSKRIIRINSYVTNDVSLVEFKDAALQQILSFFVAACFAGPITGAQGNGIKKKKKKGTSAAEIASRMGSVMPQRTREVLVARLFSLLSESTSVAYNSAHDSPKSATREIEMFKPFLHVMEECKNLQSHSSSLADEIVKESDDEDDTAEESAKVVSKLLASAKKTMEITKEVPSPRDRFAASMGTLAAFLQLCLASSEDADNELADISGMADENDSDDIQALIGEAGECFDASLEETGTKSNELSRLVALCLNLLSWESDDTRGASMHLVRDIVKVVLPSGLMVMAKTSKTAKLDPEVAEMILQSVGVVREEEHEDPEEDADSNEDGEDDESNADMDESDTFAKAASLSLVEGKENIEDSDLHGDEEDGQQPEEDEDIFIDNDRLNSLLEEDSDMEGEGKELEHHEGADAALASLIKLKQEARKAGQAAKERLKLSRQMRCMPVLETLTNGKPESWGPLLRCDIVMSMVPSLLSRICQLEKAASKVIASDPCANERDALSKRLTLYVSTKLLKSKMGSMPWSESVDAKAHCQHVIGEVLEIARPRTVSEHQRTFCYQALPSLFRCMPSFNTRVEIASALYNDAAVDWSTKKSTRITCKLFDELIRRDCALAQSVLLVPLSRAAFAGRVRFLRSECFRMLSELYNPKLNKGTSDEEKQALESLMGAREEFVEAAIFALNDSEMMKWKWLKDVLGTIEKVICFESPHLLNPEALSTKTLEPLEAALKSVAENNNGEHAKKICETLLSKVEIMKQSAPAAESDSNVPEGKKSKKKKNKKNKNK